MFKQLEIQNFQSHRHSRIDLCEGLNVITGSSDSGKSTIIRAIRWVIENRPSGDSIKNWECGKDDSVDVSIELSNDIRICKERVNGKVKYLVDSPRGSWEFEAVRMDVPEEVSKEFDLSEFNIQTQHDPYFLLNDSPGEVAKKLNDLVGLSIIDTIFQNLNAKITFSKKTSKELSDRIESLSGEIASLDWLEDASRDLQVIEDLQNLKANLLKKYEETTDLVDRHAYFLKERSKNCYLLALEEPLNKVSSLLTSYQERKEKFCKIKEDLHLLDDLDKNIEETEDWLKVERSYRLLTRKINVCENREQQLSNLLKVCNDHSTWSEKYSKHQISLTEKKKEFSTFLKKYKVCPFCGGGINDKIIEERFK